MVKRELKMTILTAWEAGSIINFELTASEKFAKRFHIMAHLQAVKLLKVAFFQKWQKNRPILRPSQQFKLIKES